MMRLASGGLIDRSTSLRFSFDGRSYAGHLGDTLASALLANGVRLFGRSFKYHRPRGVLSAGPEEPNALVELYVMDPTGANRVKVDLGSDPDIYLARVTWSRDGKALCIQRQNREQTVLDVLKVDPATGKSSILFSERSGAKSWVNLSNALTPLDDGSVLWWSERDGHGHLYRFAKGQWTQLTTGDW